MLLSSDAERLLIAPVPVLRLHAMPNLQFSVVARSIARLIKGSALVVETIEKPSEQKSCLVVE